MAFPSTYADIKNEVIAKLRLDATNDASKVGDWVNQVYAEVCVETESEQASTTQTMTPGTSEYTLASSVLRIKQAYVTPSGGQQSRPLVPVSLEQVLEWLGDNPGNSTPTHYCFVGRGKIKFFPTPAAADVVTYYYVALPTALSGSTDVPVLQEPYVTECLVNGACFKGAVFLKDPDAMLFKQLYDQALRRYRGHLRRREGSMTRQFRVTRGDVVVPHDPSVDRGW